MYGNEPEPEVIAIYASLEDANSKVYGMKEERKDDGGHWVDYDASVHEDGCLSWWVGHNGDETGGVIISVEKVEILPSGSEPARDWRKAFEDPWSESEEENH